MTLTNNGREEDAEVHEEVVHGCFCVEIVTRDMAAKCNETEHLRIHAFETRFPLLPCFKLITRKQAFAMNGRQLFNDTTGRFTRLPDYTTDAAADYRVLCHVREKWTHEQQDAFGDKLHATHSRRWNNPFPATKTFMACLYQPGDYARAALSVVRASDGNNERSGK